MNNHISYSHYTLFIACWVLVGIGAGLYLLRREAPYGKFSNHHWGPMISNKLGWILMEATVIVTFLSWLPLRQLRWQSPAGIMILLFLVHYLHRSLIYPFMTRTKGKKMPAVIMLSAMLFNTVNGSLLGIWFARFAAYPANWCASPAFITGCILYITGMLINWRTDYQLIHLRGKGETGYKIPQKGLFQYVTSPNLLGEIVEWSGYALLTWSLPALAFLCWTCANLLPRAIANQRWYKQQFPEYPPERKILIPFLW
ncbi:MAG TPA: 3-oxo-5-alpha-steroid 4-dehydrogenase [Chitinophaga sp.]